MCPAEGPWCPYRSWCLESDSRNTSTMHSPTEPFIRCGLCGGPMADGLPWKATTVVPATGGKGTQKPCRAEPPGPQKLALPRGTSLHPQDSTLNNKQKLLLQVKRGWRRTESMFYFLFELHLLLLFQQGLHVFRWHWAPQIPASSTPMPPQAHVRVSGISEYEL